MNTSNNYIIFLVLFIILLVSSKCNVNKHINNVSYKNISDEKILNDIEESLTKIYGGSTSEIDSSLTPVFCLYQESCHCLDKYNFHKIISEYYNIGIIRHIDSDSTITRALELELYKFNTEYEAQEVYADVKKIIDEQSLARLHNETFCMTDADLEINNIYVNSNYILVLHNGGFLDYELNDLYWYTKKYFDKSFMIDDNTSSGKNVFIK